MNTKKRINEPSKLSKSPVARGLAGAVVEDGGDNKAGCVYGFSAITAGEALGHGLWIDNFFLNQVSDAINGAPKGMKSRFTHPGFSGDGLGTYLGRAKSAAIDGSLVRADAHFSKSAHDTPDGDLAGYVMKLAKDDPAAFGASIVFTHDYEAEDAFMAANSRPAANGGEVAFISPDPANVNNYPHARLKELRAVDFVDDPAANPAGMFHREAGFIAEAERVAEFCLGLSAECPTTTLLSVHPERAKGFVSRFLQSRNLFIGEQPMPQGKHTPKAPASEAEVKPAGVEATSAAAKPAELATSASEAPAEAPAPAAGSPEGFVKARDTRMSEGPQPSDGAKFLADFGRDGAVWFVEGKSYDEAAKLHAEKAKAEAAALKAENEALKAKLGRGEAAPVAFSGAQSADAKQLQSLVQATGSEPLAKFAASVKLPAAK